MNRMMTGIALVAMICLPFAAAGDERPVVDDRGAREKRPGETLPTLWIAGDSTVRSNAPLRGWGQELDAFFDRRKIQLVNRAIGGRSSRTFHTEGRWQEILDELEKGDFVLIQFGHNDVGPTDGRSKFRGSVKGIGDETEEVEMPDGRIETVRTYGWYLREYARTAKAKGATVILCSPVPHKDFNPDGTFRPDWAVWREWVAACAEAEGAGYIDLAALVGARYAELGKEKVEALFADQRTHTSAAGARLNAEILVEAIDRLEGDPLDEYLVGGRP